jgi:predicted nuclease with TOPRIM domain
MTFNKFEELLDKSEALVFFEQYKTEATRLSAELEQEREQHRDQIQRLEKRVSKFESLKIKYNEKDYALEEFDTFVQKRVDEAEEKLIDRRVQEKWVREMPALIEQRLKIESQKYPSDCSPLLKEIVESKATFRVDELLKNMAA